MMDWLADVLRSEGLTVTEIPGWHQRGHGEMAADVLGVLCHHTAGPAAGNYPSLITVRDGRPDLAGPLANLGLARDGTWIVIAAGQAWHAGSGSISWCPADEGNRHLIGVEAESVGARDDWTPAQRSSYPRGTAALLAHLGLPASRAIGHKEWAPGRKIDPAFWDMNQFRRAVSALMTVPASGGPTPPTPAPTAPEDDVPWLAKDGAPPIHDYYPGAKADLPDPATALAWAAAHAANARDAAATAGAKVDALRADIAAGKLTPALDYDQLAKALLKQMGQAQ